MTKTMPPGAEEKAKTVAETKHVQAQTKRTLAETKEAGHKARREEIHLVRQEMNLAYEMAADENNQTYHFDRPVTEKTVRNCLRSLSTWHRLLPDCDIELIISSPGGYVIPGFALFDYLNLLSTSGHAITTTVLGQALSMAAVLTQAGTTRSMGRGAWMLIHEMKNGTWGTYGQLVDELDWMRRSQDRIVSIFDNASNLTSDEIREKWDRRDWYIDAEQALAYGLVDSLF